MTLSFCTPSITSPRSSKRTGDPLRYVTTKGRYAAALNTCPFASTVNAWRGPHKVPEGRLTLWLVMEFSTSSMPMPRVASLLGSSCTWTANLAVPNTFTCDTPLMLEMAGAISVSAYSSTRRGDMVCELRPMKRMGWSAGFTFWTLGGAGRLGGSRRDTAAIADWVSCDAASILRSSTNCMVMLVVPRTLDDDMESRPGTVENCRSRMVATDAAMVSGLAPGRLACT